MTRTAMAKALGISQPYLSNLFHGHRRPSYKMAQRIKPLCFRTYEWWCNARQPEVQKLLDRVERKLEAA